MPAKRAARKTSEAPRAARVSSTASSSPPPPPVPAPSSQSLPPFTSDRLRLLAPLITPRALELAHHRLLNYRDRISEADADETTKRIALLLLIEMNPDTYLTNEEEGIRRGMAADTFGIKRRAHEL